MSSWDPGRLTPARRVTARGQLPRGDNGTPEMVLPLRTQETERLRPRRRRDARPTWGERGAEHLVSELRRPGEGSELRPNPVCAFVESPRT